MKNSTSNGVSGFKGISKNTSSKLDFWEAYLAIPQSKKSKKIYIGSYPTISEAVEAREEFIKSLF